MKFKCITCSSSIRITQEQMRFANFQRQKTIWITRRRFEGVGTIFETRLKISWLANDVLKNANLQKFLNINYLKMFILYIPNCFVEMKVKDVISCKNIFCYFHFFSPWRRANPMTLHLNKLGFSLSETGCFCVRLNENTMIKRPGVLSFPLACEGHINNELLMVVRAPCKLAPWFLRKCENLR